MSDDFNEWVVERLLASGKITPELVNAFTPYIEPDPEEKNGVTLGKLIADKKLGKGLVITSKHPRNAFLNLKSIFTGSVATIAGLAGGAAAWAAPLLGLVAVVQFMDSMKIELGDNHAKVILWLWDKKRQSAWVHKSELTAALAAEIKPEALEEVLDDLEKLHAIEFNEEDGSIWKTEYLVIKSSAGI